MLPHQNVVRWTDGSALAFVMADGSAFGIWKKGKLGIHQGRGGEHLHFAFQIEPAEYDSFCQKLSSAGAKPMEHVWPSGQRSVYFFDPDGHQGEFITCDWFGLRAKG